MNEADVIQHILNNGELMETARKTIEDRLIEFRDSRISLLDAANGLVVRESNGHESSLVRLSILDALRIGLGAIKEAYDAKS